MSNGSTVHGRYRRQQIQFASTSSAAFEASHD